MSTVSMQGAIEQMRALAAQAGGGAKKPATTGTGGFGEALRASLDQVSNLQQTANGEAQAFQAGKPGIELSNVMIDTQEAGLAFQMAVQMRNRLVNAYKQVMDMQV